MDGVFGGHDEKSTDVSMNDSHYDGEKGHATEVF